ncbi:MAG: hypothetical protein Q9188_000555 [Gyalolechia gomerana]
MVDVLSECKSSSDKAKLSGENVNARTEETSGSEPLEHVSQDTISVSTLLPTNGQPTGKQTEGNGDCASTEKHIESTAPISDPLSHGSSTIFGQRRERDEELGNRDTKDTQEDQKSMLIEDKQTLSTNISIPYDAPEMSFAV